VYDLFFLQKEPKTLALRGLTIGEGTITDAGLWYFGGIKGLNKPVL
jgi:hypothetical protein